MSSVQVDSEKVIAKMARQIGQLSAELAATQAALDAALEALAEIEQAAAEEAPVS